MSPAQCAIGIRIVNLIDKMGFDQQSIEIFLSEVYTRLQEVGATPKYIARYVEGLVSLLDDLNLNQERTAAISLREIDKILEKKKEDDRMLQEQFSLCESKLRDTNQKIVISENELQKLLGMKRSIEVDLGWKSELRDQLQKNGLAVNDISNLVEGARFFRDRGSNINEMLTTFSNYKGMQSAIAGQERELGILKAKAQQIKDENRVQEELLQKNKLRNSELDAIKSMGFGLSHLKRLHYLLDEVSKEAGLPTEENAAVIKFFQELEEHYDVYVNLGKKVDERRAEIRKLSVAQDLLSITLNLTPEIDRMVQNLARKGIKKDDLEHITRMIEENRLPRSKNSSDEKDLVMENHPGSEYSYSKTEIGGREKTVTEESISSSGLDLRRADNRKRDVIAKTDANPCVIAYDMNLQQIVAQIHETYTPHKDDKVFFLPKPSGGPLGQANKSRISKKLPRFPVGIRKYRSARLKRNLHGGRKELNKPLANYTSNHNEGRQLIQPSLEVSSFRSPSSPNPADPRPEDHEMPKLVQGVKPTIGTSSHIGVRPSTLQEIRRPVLNVPSSNESNLDNKWDSMHLNVGDLVRDSMKSVIDDSLRRLNRSCLPAEQGIGKNIVGLSCTYFY